MELNFIESISGNSIDLRSDFESHYNDQENISINDNDILNIFMPILPIPIPPIPISPYFIIERDATNDTNFLKSKKRGRHTKLREKKKNHDKFSFDNIQRKIQVHFISYIIFFLNDILKSFGIKEKFLKLDYQFKKDINKQKFNEFKSKNIGEIVSNNISTKYKKKENNNSDLYKNLKTNKELGDLGTIFKMNYMTFFKMYYMKNEKTIEIKMFGIQKKITLSKKSETYHEFIEKEKLKENNENYINKINECLNKRFLKSKKFVLC